MENTAKSIAVASIFVRTEDFVVSMRFFKSPNVHAQTLIWVIAAN